MSQVLKLGITKNNNKKIEEVFHIEVLANKGIIGDRHFNEYNNPYYQLTLIESENIDYYNKKYNLNIAYLDFRRNIVTKGIKLNDLIGKKITNTRVAHYQYHHIVLVLVELKNKRRCIFYFSLEKLVGEEAYSATLKPNFLTFYHGSTIGSKSYLQSTLEGV